MQQQVGIAEFFQRCFECADQMVRQLADKADRVAEQDFLGVRDALFTRGRVQGIKQAVVGRDTGVGQQVEQRRFARIGVADNSYQRQLGLFALAALDGAHLAHLFQVVLELIDAAADVPAVGFQLGFTRTARTDRAFAAARRLAHQVGPHAGQARQNILILCQFDLQFTLAGAGALGKNVQNQRRTVEHGPAHDFLQIAQLRGG